MKYWITYKYYINNRNNGISVLSFLTLTIKLSFQSFLSIQKMCDMYNVDEAKPHINLPIKPKVYCIS